MAEFAYAGGELELFRLARNWKAYWKKRLARYVSGRVLEVGAGIGANTATLADLAAEEWVCLEPDPALAARLAAALGERRRNARACRVHTGTLRDLPPEPHFDSVLYLDVLEHIEDDHGEVAEAARRLCAGGHLVVLAPAHPVLFSPFDRAIGHFRRYTRASLAAAAPPGLRPVRLIYLDAVGLFASLANRLLLNQSLPTRRQILAWDRFMVPASRWIDPLLGYRVGKSVMGIWRKR